MPTYLHQASRVTGFKIISNRLSLETCPGQISTWKKKEMVFSQEMGFTGLSNSIVGSDRRNKYVLGVKMHTYKE